MTDTSRKPVMITEGFARRVNAAVKDFETRPESPDRPRRRPVEPIDVPIRVTAVYDNYLAGYRWDFEAQDVTGPLLYVAKPYMLQRLSWESKTIDGITYAWVSTTQRTATDAEDNTENQIIVPAYNLRVSGGYGGDLIWGRLGATGLTDPAGEPIYLRDRNEDGRAWAKE